MNKIHKTVKDAYADLIKTKDARPRKTSSCCGGPPEQGKTIGYTEQDLNGAASIANLGIGCGNPEALAQVQKGEVIVDLGSGAGFDALLAAPKLGPEGRFIGVDMTPEMLASARKNAVKAGYAQTVEFREGLIEDLPISSESADAVISNCVINLSPEKEKVFQEAYRVLKPGGRIAVSDIVLTEPLPQAIADSLEGWVACVSGASLLDDYLGFIANAGFSDVELQTRPAADLLEGMSEDPLMKKAVAQFGMHTIRQVASTVVSASITARKA